MIENIPTDKPPGDDARDMVAAIAARLQSLRTAQGWSASALARRAGIAKSTLTQLEQGKGNPGIETLWALAGALGVPFAELITSSASTVRIVRADEGMTMHDEAAALSATLMTRLDNAASQSLYCIDVAAGTTHRSSAHLPGTVEHLLVTSGRLVAGPDDAPATLSTGDYMRFPGDVAHYYRATEDADARAVLVMAYR